MPFLDIDGVTDGAKVAELQTITFSKLLDDDEHETAKLLAACEDYGFFYLDLTSGGSSHMLENEAELRTLMNDWFSQDEKEKLKTETISNAHGYKPVGVQSGISAKGKDGWEALKIGRNELLGRWALPSVVKSHRALFDDFTASSHFVLKTVLDGISRKLSSSNLHQFHPDDEPSKSTLYFLHYPALSADELGRGSGTGQNMHTDIGSLTLLFAPQWGLQALSPGTGEWEWVEPRVGHAVINVGDTLRFLSGRRLRSALHRAVQAEGVDRFSISYFLRASDSTKFKDSSDEATDAKSWYLRKYETYEKSHEMQKREKVLTGGMMEELTCNQ